ncbi:hypothetical protein HER10_EVM0009779 [Colletotrichum scovillei]|uniref:Uncharacterized protein n=1 Tax=Colletotrichum scovillei TaxID=1209932 RepID=A0A9P7U8H5_9PEZI|nr:uncharacterized protein HER10_EVM0009779 [Colletotrichum scovillei]KAF4784568.1 hypothetical protein HER10_EVM0009779 [Colletotrichum scovillei]KAG7044323.1 hypothetical protein JMJ77_0003786 [Colletotrichum scovillei]KAG7049032.1 hypothetical protein JMJ78_0013016 [Colletotrichum scovillei]KAG7063776.1 hypothetical protein JMJ76_0006825 [Colletotrichum scovillei]
MAQDRCWFVLRQAHYPAPKYATPNMARGKAEGPIQLGHIIPRLKDIDQVINSSGPNPLPRDVRIWPTVDKNFNWAETRDSETNAKTAADIPLLSAPGLSAQGDIQLAFKKTVNNFAQFDKLDRQIIQPTKTYIDQSLRSPQVSDYIEEHKSSILELSAWKLYMISGIMIARGGRTERAETKHSRANIGPKIAISELATTEATIQSSSSNSSSMTGEHVTDFVWAVRLTEIKKPLLGTHTQQKTVTKGATFGVGSSEVDVEKVMSDIEDHDLEVVKHVASDNEESLLLFIPV